ncbi:hypothetical protein B0I18_104318 [Taibaiella chishuiensis]|uniref:Uncharacterized protein n=1 Tax=Taibaiella chishuiensis TaxID=1434707 RepID=A0A2P8D4W6_9BACT|nr:hypothetical protein B0I18_104318 [Taibaiella chishuiensis]
MEKIILMCGLLVNTYCTDLTFNTLLLFPLSALFAGCNYIFMDVMIYAQHRIDSFQPAMSFLQLFEPLYV